MTLLSEIQTSYSVHTKSRRCKVVFSLVIKLCPNNVFLCNFRYGVRHQINLQSMSLVFFFFFFKPNTKSSDLTALLSLQGLRRVSHQGTTVFPPR